MTGHSRSFAHIVAWLVPAIASAQLHVWVVDDDGPADFAAIQPAVDASASGDVIVVRAGSYANFSVVGKGVSIVGDEGAAVAVLGASGANQTLVSGVPAHQRACLRGLDFVPPLTLTQNSLRVADCAGVVWIEDVSVAAAIPFPFSYFLTEFEAVEILGSAQVVLADVDIVGSPGVPPGFGLEGGQEGLAVSQSNAYLYRCNVRGGATIVLGGEGRVGTRALQSLISLRDSVSQGGQGGQGGVFTGPNPGNGGPGLFVSAGSSVWATGSQLLGGPGGVAVLGGGSGSPGPPFTSAGGTVVQHAATNVDFDSMALVRDDDDALLRVETTPGSILFLLASFATQPVFVSAWPDTLAVGLSPILVPIGTTPALGKVDLSIGIPPLPPGLPTWNMTLQVAALVGGFELELSNATIVTIVDDQY